MLVVRAQRDDMLVELSPFSRDVVARVQSDLARVLYIVEKIAPTIGQMTVGIRVPDAPVKGVAGEGVLSRQLTVVSSAAAVEIFGAVLVIRLCVNAFAPGISARSQLVEDILQLVFVITVTREKCQIKHCAETHVRVVLVVGRVAQIVGVVVRSVVYAEEVVLHVGVRALLVGIVDRCEHTQFVSVEVPTATHARRKLQVAHGFALPYKPVVVQLVARQAVQIVAHGLAVGSSQRV